MSNLRRLRREAGLTQSDLASRAGVSRQLVGAVEAGRHLPRVDAAIALAAVLGVEVAQLFAPSTEPLDVVSGEAPTDGVPVRAGRVGDRIVTARARVGPDGWDVADGIVDGGELLPFEPGAAGVVVVGCEPGLELAERILREHGMRAVAVTASSAAAIEALRAGRAHAAVVHGPRRRRSQGLDIDRIRLTRWRVGLAAPPHLGSDWPQQALAGSSPVIQREPGAGVQAAFEAAATRSGTIPGPRVGSHFDAAQRGVLTGLAAVTIEPAALAVGAQFHAIESHEAELWVDRAWRDSAVVAAALDVFASRRFRDRLRAIGGYDLSNVG